MKDNILKTTIFYCNCIKQFEIFVNKKKKKQRKFPRILEIKVKMLIRLLLLAVYLVQIISTACPVEDDPTNLARCIQVDTSAIVGLAKGSNDMTSFCALADRYMECIKTYTRGCVGFFVIENLFIFYFPSNM